MYPSGWWDGFWVQDGYGRQPMREFELRFAADGTITGSGKDMVGRFTFSGAYDRETGHVLMVKQYVGKHTVRYTGDPDGEGSIQGTWEITSAFGLLRGTFMLKPVVRKPGADAPIEEIG